MKKIIRKILKEEVEISSLKEILPLLKKIYPKLDYCISDDGKKIKVYTYYGSNYDYIHLEEDEEELHETGVIIILNDKGTFDVGIFDDYRDYAGDYLKKNTDFIGDRVDKDFKYLVQQLDYDLGIDPDPRIKSLSNYAGYPEGLSSFDWKEC